MKIIKNKFVPILIIATLLAGCELLEKTKDRYLPQFNTKENTLKSQKQISIICGKGDIKEYTEKGWKVLSSSSREVTCSWKSKQATPGCNIERDKGCRITVPDKKGKEVRYLLEKEIPNS